MQYFLFIYLFFLTFLNQEIKVISYNIRYNNPNDGKDIWENRRSSVVDFIKNENPDFLGLQEVTLSQLTYLNTNLTEYSYVGVGRDDGKTKGEYSPIYYKKTLFELLKTETFWLSKTPGSISVGWDASMERICTYGYFKVRNSDKKLWIFNSHFDHIGKIAREESAKLILKKISELSKKMIMLY
jgi:endonuclease/exonuclease/phosphatase family metal-dependent hydrolase